MKKVKLRDLQDWPPAPGGVTEPGTFYPTAGEAVVNEIFAVRDNTVTFRGIFQGQSHSYHFKTASEKIAVLVHAVIEKNAGSTVADFGNLEIEI